MAPRGGCFQREAAELLCRTIEMASAGSALVNGAVLAALTLSLATTAVSLLITVHVGLRLALVIG